MAKLGYKRDGCDLVVGDHVRMPSTVEDERDHFGEYPHYELTGTIFAIDTEHRKEYVIGVLLDQTYDEFQQKPFARLDRLNLQWEGYEEFVTEKGHSKKSYRWFPIREVVKVEKTALETVLIELEREVL